MMLLFYLVSVFHLIDFSISKQCPSSTFCVCSSDLTIITCAKRQLTDESFATFSRHLPETTIVLNISSNSLTSINWPLNLRNLQILDLSFNKIQHLPSNLFTIFPQLTLLNASNNELKSIPKNFNGISNINLDISNNPLNCTCSLKWLVQWFETINVFKKINCQKSEYLKEGDFCPGKRNSIYIEPEKSQIVYEEDRFSLNCSSNTKTFWSLNGRLYSTESAIVIPRVTLNHSGLWTCHSLNLNRSVLLHVLRARMNHFCQPMQMDTSKGHFYWPRTLAGRTTYLKCPFGSAAWLTDSSDNANGYYTCSSNRQWTDLDLSKCAFRTNVSRELDRLLFSNSTDLLPSVLGLISKIDFDEFEMDDAVFLIDLIDEEKEKLRFTRVNIETMSTFIYQLSDLILQMNHDSLLNRHYQLSLYRLRFILEELLYLTNQSWVYLGKELAARTLESPTICSVPNQLSNMDCGVIEQQHKRQELLLTIQFPSASVAKATDQISTVKLLLYRRSTLFVSNTERNSNPVVHLLPVMSSNMSQVTVTFHTHINQAFVAAWNPNNKSWQTKTPLCRISSQSVDSMSSDCFLTENMSLSITYLNQIFEHRSLLLNPNYFNLAVQVSSILASVCLFICIVCYVCCHKVYLMPRSFFHCLTNYWLSLTILFPLSAFGLKQSQYLLFCQVISIALHYLCLTTILWLTLLTYCIWQKLYVIWSGKGHGGDIDEDHDGKPSVTVIDYDDDGLPIIKLKAKPVIQFYFLAYGISFIICGINVAISREQYFTSKICFLNNFESLLTLLIPVGIFIFLLLVFLLSARFNIKRLTKEAVRLRNLPDESDAEPELNDGENENESSSKPNEALPIIIPSENDEKMLPHPDCHQSHLNSLCSSDMDHQHQPSNQLLSILFQLVLLCFIFVSRLSIYITPLRSDTRLEHSIYNYLYGFFVLLLAFYVLAFYLLSRSDLTMHCQYNSCRKRRKKHLLDQSYNEPPPPPQTPQQSPSLPVVSISTRKSENKFISESNLTADESLNEQIPSPSPPHSNYSSSMIQCQQLQSVDEVPVTDSVTYGSKRQTHIASKYYARYRHLLKSNVTASDHGSGPEDSSPRSTANGEQKSTESAIEQHNLVQEEPSKTLSYSASESHELQHGNTKLRLPSVCSSRACIPALSLSTSTHPQQSPSQAIIRPLPIVRLSSPNTNKPLSNSPSEVTTNNHTNPIGELNDTGRNSYRIMPSPSTEERHATYVYLNKNSHLIQQNISAEEQISSWKKANGHHSHVAYIDEDDEGSVSLKSSTRDSTTADSSSTTSPAVSRKGRSQTLSYSSSSSTFSNDFGDRATQANELILHESSV